MGISCPICFEKFTVADKEEIYSTSCGHVYHQPCLLQWIERTSDCPLCRTKISEACMFKLDFYFHTYGSCQQRTANFLRNVNNTKLKRLKGTWRISSEESDGLRLQVQKLDRKIKRLRYRNGRLRKKNQHLKVELDKKKPTDRRAGNADYRNIPSGMIEINEQKSNRLLEIINSNVIDEEPEIIDLEDSSRESNSRNRSEVQRLRRDIQIKKLQLASALARISELEKEKVAHKKNETSRI